MMRPSGGASIPTTTVVTRSSKPIKPFRAPAPTTPKPNRPPARPAQPTQPARPSRPAQPARRTPASTDPLAPLGPGQLRQQATKTVTKAYGGQFTDLNNQATQAQNLYHTQTADDAAFNQWLLTQSASMQAATNAVNQKLVDVMNGIRQSQSDTLGAMPGQLAGQENAQQNVVAPGQVQQGLSGLTAPGITAANARTAADTERVVTEAQAGNALLAGSAGVATGRVEQAKAAQFATLNKTLNNIASERTKILAARTGDIAKEIARLNGIEISKAQFRANQGNLQAELGIKQAGVKIAAQNADTSALRASETARHNAAVEKINSTRYADQSAHNAAVQAETQRHNQAMEGIGQQNANANTTRADNSGSGAAGRKGKSTAASPTQQREVRNYIDALRNALIHDMQKYGRNNLSVAYNDVKAGRITLPASLSPPLGADPTSYLNVAVNTLTQYGALGLSPGDQQFLTRLGVSWGNWGYPVNNPNAHGKSGGRPAGA